MQAARKLTSFWNWLRSRFYCRLADAHRHFGNQYASQAEHWAAIENYTRATVLDPDYTQAYYNRGVLYWREIGNHYRAVQDLTRVLELAPDWAAAYFNRGMAHKLRNEPDQALADFERYLAASEDDFWQGAAQRQIAEIQETWNLSPTQTEDALA
jgi:tetratricopeptide (TPR) repeat protein